MTIDEMRAALGLGPGVPDIDVLEAYVASLGNDVENPPPPLLTLAAVKQHLKVYDDGDDELIQGYLDAALGALDGPTGQLGRSLTKVTRTARLDRIGTNAIWLPYPPVVSILGIELFSGGAWSVVDASTYEFDDGKLALAPGKSWPSVGPCKVAYTAGYDVLPKPIQAAVMIMCGDLYRFRESAAVGVTAASKVPMSTAVETLLGPFRIFP